MARVREKSCTLTTREWSQVRSLVMRCQRLLFESTSEFRAYTVLMEMTMSFWRYETDWWTEVELRGGIAKGAFFHVGLLFGRSQFFRVRKAMIDRGLAVTLPGQEVAVNVPGILDALGKSQLGSDPEIWTQSLRDVAKKSLEDFQRAGWPLVEVEMASDSHGTLEDMVQRGLIISKEAREKHAKKVVKLPVERMSGKKLLVFIEVTCEKYNTPYVGEKSSGHKLGAMLKSWVSISARNGKDPTYHLEQAIKWWHLLDGIQSYEHQDRKVSLGTVFSFERFYHNRAEICDYLDTNKDEFDNRMSPEERWEGGEIIADCRSEEEKRREPL